MRWPAITTVFLVIGGVLLSNQASAAADPVVRPGGGGGDWIQTEVSTPGGRGAGVAAEGQGPVVDVAAGAAPAPCTYRPLTSAESVGVGATVEAGPEGPRTGGQFVLQDCSASGGGRLILWVPDGEDGAAPAGVPQVTPGMLAAQARNSLQLPTPTVGVSPDGLNDNPALVNLPTWWWVTNGEALTQRTELGSVWAEVTAEPVSSAWVAGDGERSECSNLGTAYVSGMREDEPGKCSHTYVRPNRAEQAEIQVVWQVSWVGSGGTGGTLEPFTLTATQAVPVYERHAIVTSSG